MKMQVGGRTIELSNPEKKLSDELTTEQRRIKRRERLYIDVMRNVYVQTGVVPYFLRPFSKKPCGKIEKASIAWPNRLWRRKA